MNLLLTSDSPLLNGVLFSIIYLFYIVLFISKVLTYLFYNFVLLATFPFFKLVFQTFKLFIPMNYLFYYLVIFFCIVLFIESIFFFTCYRIYWFCIPLFDQEGSYIYLIVFYFVLSYLLPAVSLEVLNCYIMLLCTKRF